MEARGYRGDLTVYSQVERPPAPEIAAIAVMAVAVTVYSLTIRYGVIP
jgi:cobalt/nickel transport system permease protein